MDRPLNATLYKRLKDHFGTVRISNAGEAMIATDIELLGRPRLNVTQIGEYYQVCCPYCNDSRFRLYIHHMYGRKMDSGRRLNFLAVCYNETACMSRPENQDDLRDTLNEIDGVLSRARVLPGKESTAVVVADWPGPCVPVAELKSNHPARQYLRDVRKFDVEYLSRRFDIRYCTDSRYFLARDRLIIPVFDDKRLVGWQARYVGELEWKNKSKHLPPKYFTMPGMPRRLLLYNFDAAKRYETCIIMEGPTDVWAMGAMGVCTFGASMNNMQQRRVITVFRDRTVVLLYDPEEFGSKATRALVDTLELSLSGRLAVVKLPNGTDPGSLDREFLRDYVYTEAKKQGVRVSFRRVKK